MIAILSPARNVRPFLDWQEGHRLKTTCPSFPRETEELVREIRQFSPWQLESLLDVPPKRAFDLYDAYQAFDMARPGTPALLAYYGAAYRNMAPEEFSDEELVFAQGHLRILSALYGMLRPLDGILEHRLGLKKAFSPGGKNLHQYWGDALCRALYSETDLVMNLASGEYAMLITPHMRPGQHMVTCRFLLDKPGGPRGTVSTVRAARGLMTRFLIRNKINRPEDLTGFDADGYEYTPALSSRWEYAFVKRQRC